MYILGLIILFAVPWSGEALKNLLPIVIFIPSNLFIDLKIGKI